MHTYKKALFIHRRDLRIDDNTALSSALKQSETVIPIFIFDPRQAGPKNEYRSDKAQQFLCESLTDLQEQYTRKQGKLYVLEGEAHTVVEQLLTETKADAVFVNLDYTPFSQERDARIAEVCEKHEAAFIAEHDALLVGNPAFVTTGSGEPYKVFTPFYKFSAGNIEVKTPMKMPKGHLFTGLVKGSDLRLIARYNPDEGNQKPRIKGGRKACLGILKKITNYAGYKDTRDDPYQDTTHLAAHNKFGTCSIREVYYAIAGALGRGHDLIRQLYWRDFFTQLAHAFPRVFGSAFNEKFNAITWRNNKEEFAKWCEGMTGFPIVDAGMRELNETGFMHNRARMIVASFLTKDLHIDWRWGEKYFAQKLVDYDPCVNNGSWQWAAGTGADAAPYFRIFNPWLQQKKFDPECRYIFQWVKELAGLEPAVVHKLEKQRPMGVEYPGPMVEHRERAREAKEMYGRCA